MFLIFSIVTILVHKTIVNLVKFLKFQKIIKNLIEEAVKNVHH